MTLEREESAQLEEMLRVDVEYPPVDHNLQVPDNWLALAVREFRKNLELAVLLERDLGGHGLYILCSAEPTSDSQDGSSSHRDGLSQTFLFYVELFKRLVECDRQGAKQEFLSWPLDETTVFTRLRIWACGMRDLISSPEAGRHFSSLGDDAFWNVFHQRDFLRAFAKRWADLSPSVVRRIERRLLRGPPRRDGEEEARYVERRSASSLGRIHWLASQGCRFHFGVDAEIAQLRANVAEWQPRDPTADTMSVRVGWVQTDSDYDALLAEPVETLLPRALELSNQPHDLFVQKDPFAGLVATRPLRALAALNHASKGGEFPEWAWRAFLTSEARKSDKPKLAALIAERLARFPSDAVAELIHPMCEWLLATNKVLLADLPKQFGRVWERSISVLRTRPSTTQSLVVRRSKEPEWAIEALNSPAGKLAQALMGDPQCEGLERGQGFPMPWLSRVSALLALGGDAHRHALVIFAHGLNWFFEVDPDWADRNLLSALEEEDSDRDAFWAGFFWAAHLPKPQLYVRLKPSLISLAKERSLTRQTHNEVLSGILLAGWGSVDIAGQQYVSDAEMRDVLIHTDNDFRSALLWQLRAWCSGEHDADWSTKAIRLLADVWPRQKVVKTPAVSSRLLNLCVAVPSRFSELVDVTLPLLSRIDRGHFGMERLRRSTDGLVDRFPEKTLALLFAVLAEEPFDWPYGIAETLEAITDADPSLKADERLIELRRRWNAR